MHLNKKAIFPIIIFSLGISLIFGVQSLTKITASLDEIIIDDEQLSDVEKNIYISPLYTDMMEALSNRQVHPFNEKKIISKFDLNEFTKAAETDIIELWINEQWNTIRIINKNTGYIWGSLPLKDAKDLNVSWNNYGNSIAAIECFNEEGIEARYSLTSNAKTSYTYTDSGFICHADFIELGIYFDILVNVDGNKITLSIKEESLIEGIEDSAFRLKSLTFIPYMGASYSDEIDGYCLIPDGCGALIRFQKPASYTAYYTARIFGKDYGIEALSNPSDLQAYRPNDYIVAEPQVLIPVYGIVHGAYQNSLLYVVEQGAEYASILASPALLNNPYNNVCARFEYRQKYNKNINRKEGAGAVIPQEDINEITPKLSIYILDGDKAHYDGMALYYKSILEEKNMLNMTKTDDESIPIRIEVLGADLKNEVFGTSTELFTSVDDASSILSRLYDCGINNISFIYKCYAKNNEIGNTLINKVGNQKDFTKLAEIVNKNGGRFYYYLNPITATKDQINLRTEAANNLSNMVIKLSRSNNLLMYQDKYFYRFNVIKKRITYILEKAIYGKDAVFAIDGLTNYLYGDFTSGKESTRNIILGIILDLVKKIADGKCIPLYQPNEYLLNYASEIYDIPLCSGQFLYETDTVPFLQIITGGNIPLFGTPLNTGTYSLERILRHIEYGTYPSFIVTACDSRKLYKTAQEDYFSTNYNDQEKFINEAYYLINEALSNVIGQGIVEHKALDNGFIRVTYENGVKIYINYTNRIQYDGDIEVNANWYHIE